MEGLLTKSMMESYLSALKAYQFTLRISSNPLRFPTLTKLARSGLLAHGVAMMESLSTRLYSWVLQRLSR
ncbi:hypothetical protein HU200_048882 [Digitaria exilis]|uniref:Uncharacterized protein n=1 Tax=Digitaria exilis TaxID=1010633 RepID=A0A835E7D0_9POAL|nr:hypothetical protein HU200_048882 [Digitaria exilis]